MRLAQPEFVTQTHRDDVPARVRRQGIDYEAVLDLLSMPVAWAYDDYLDTWLPAEMHTRSPVALFDAARRIDCDRLRHIFARDGFVKIPAMLPRRYAEVFLTRHYSRTSQHDRWPEAPEIRRTFVHNMPLMRLIHAGSASMVCHITGERLKTSYSFAAAYEAGSSLPMHVDRPQCRYNISVMLGARPAGSDTARWPLWIRRKGRNHRITLAPGDAVLYAGTRDAHWRNVMPRELVKVFAVLFHYVSEDFRGPLD